MPALFADCRPIEPAAAIVIVVMPDHQLFGRVVDFTCILPPPLFFCDGHVVQDLRQVYPLNWVISSCGTSRPPACTRVLYLDYYVCVQESERSVGVKHTIIRAFHSVCVALGE